MKHKVIFDTDPGVDDAMALLFLHHSPDVELLAVTTTFGNVHTPTATRNAFVLLDLLGVRVPVARAKRGVAAARACVPVGIRVDESRGARGCR